MLFSLKACVLSPNLIRNSISPVALPELTSPESKSTPTRDSKRVTAMRSQATAKSTSILRESQNTTIQDPDEEKQLIAIIRDDCRLRVRAKSGSQLDQCVARGLANVRELRHLSVSTAQFNQAVETCTDLFEGAFPPASCVREALQIQSQLTHAHAARADTND